MKNRPFKWDGRRVFSPTIMTCQKKFDAKINDCINAFESECSNLSNDEYGIAIFLIRNTLTDMRDLRSQNSENLFPLRKRYIDALMWERASYFWNHSKSLSLDSKKLPGKLIPKTVRFERGVLCHGSQDVYEYNMPIDRPFDIGLMPDSEIYPRPKIIKVYCIDSDCEITQIHDDDIYWSSGMLYSDEGYDDYRFEGYRYENTSLNINQSTYKERHQLSAKIVFSSNSLPMEHYGKFRSF